jgi:hypothetical protein
MTMKIRIVGEFGEGVADKVKAFVEGLEGVQSAVVLTNGVQTADFSPEPAEPSAAETAPPGSESLEGPAETTTAGLPPTPAA